MNQNLKNYTEQPAPAVWQRITKTLAHRKAVRRVSWAAAGLVAVGTAVIVTLPREEERPMVAELNAPEIEAVVGQPRVAEQPQAVAEVVATPSETEGKQFSSSSSSSSSSEVVEPEMGKEESVSVVEEPVAIQPVTVPQQPQASVPAATPVAAEEVDYVAETPVPANIPDKSPAGSGVSNVPDMLLWFPNVFAPASDNEEINRFRAQLNKEGAMVKDFRMAVYNRAGARVFFSSDINEAWDGTRDGQPLPQSAYVYVVFYTDSEGMQHHCKGTVTLVR